MASINYQWEPLAKRPEPKTRRRSQFKAAFADTQALLDRELGQLGVKSAVLQTDVERSDIRLDGFIRAGARRRSPAIALSVTIKGRPTTFPCDTYERWEDNLRAIALSLEALRAVDRHGVSGRGEQYTGWAALPPPEAGGEFQSAAEAREFLRAIVQAADGAAVNGLAIDDIIRRAEMRTHPDRGGNPADFKRVQRARDMLLQPS